MPPWRTLPAEKTVFGIARDCDGGAMLTVGEESEGEVEDVVAGEGDKFNDVINLSNHGFLRLRARDLDIVAAVMQRRPTVLFSRTVGASCDRLS